MMRAVLSHPILACSGGAATTTTQATGGGTGLGVPGFDMLGLLAAVGLLAVFAAGIALAIALANRVSDRAVAVPIPATARISPDGYYWWDGTTWRPRT